MKIINIHSRLSLRQNSDFLAGYLPAKGVDVVCIFIELKCNL